MKKNPGRISIFLTALSESLVFCNNSNLQRLVDWKPRVQRSPVSRKMYTQKFRLYILKNLKKRGIESKNNFLVAVGKKKEELKAPKPQTNCWFCLLKVWLLRIAYKRPLELNLPQHINSLHRYGASNLKQWRIRRIIYRLDRP